MLIAASPNSHILWVPQSMSLGCADLIWSDDIEASAAFFKWIKHQLWHEWSTFKRLSLPVSLDCHQLHSLSHGSDPWPRVNLRTDTDLKRVTTGGLLSDQFPQVPFYQVLEPGGEKTAGSVHLYLSAHGFISDICWFFFFFLPFWHHKCGIDDQDGIMGLFSIILSAWKPKWGCRLTSCVASNGCCSSCAARHTPLPSLQVTGRCAWVCPV